MYRIKRYKIKIEGSDQPWFVQCEYLFRARGLKKIWKILRSKPVIKTSLRLELWDLS